MCWASVRASGSDKQGQDMIEYALVAGMITLSAGFVAPSYIVVPIKALMSVSSVQ